LAQPLVFLALLLSALLIAATVSADLAAQNPSRQRPAKEEEEEAPKPKKKQTKKPAREEEEDPTKPKGKKVPLVGDEEPDNRQPQQLPPVTTESGERIDLAREARQAKNRTVKEFFEGLAVPHDVAITIQGTRPNIEPIPHYVGPDHRNDRTFVLQRLDEKKRWQRYPATTTYEHGELAGIEPYESLTLTKVNEFLLSGLDKDTGTGQPIVPRLEMLADAEKVLQAVLAYHRSALETGTRKGEEWKEIGQALDTKLRKARLDKLRAMVDQKTGDAAFAYAAYLAETYPGQPDVELAGAQLLGQNAEQSLKEEDFIKARRWLLLLQEKHPNSAEVKTLRDQLAGFARKLMEQAVKLEEQKKNTEALTVLLRAEGIFPELPGLRDRIVRLKQKWPILYVGVPSLPENLSPATAVTDPEKQAVELIFESLIKLRYNPAAGQRYKPDLAGDLPRMVPLGRYFQLTRGAQWSNGDPVTAADVRRTVQLLHDSNTPNFNAQWAALMEHAFVGDDPFHISLTLHQGYLDPLSLMDFKVLPSNKLLTRVNDPDFAKKPIGSGPFYYKGRETGRDGQYAVFLANPWYVRPDKKGLPGIREIRFFQSKNPAADFTSGRLHLLLDLPTKMYDELKTIQGIQLKTLPNRRIYFLAVNNQNTFLSDENLRKALASAIDRESILKEHFQFGDPTRHRVLNSPYPPNSWAARKFARPEEARLFNALGAKGQLEKAKEQHARLGALSLKYPDDDPAVAAACEAIAKQALAAGIEVKPEKRSPATLHREVVEDKNYDLAYCHWDYPNEAYWLAPLLEQKFLGYTVDAEMEKLFRQVLVHREFAVVEELTHEIEKRFLDQMPFIPLWQLDTHLAIHSSLGIFDSSGRQAPPDPVLIFTDVERWVLDSKQ
jgi:ABC-type transport system substrate-binding protein